MIKCDEKVSVLMPTYNHKNSITRALNSILRQRTDFDFTLWIADDCSTDGTSEIIKDIITNNQNDRVTIKHIIAPKNLGIQNRIVHFNNLLTSDALKNQYVAWCSGDDYWINDMKLQQQYDILRENKESVSIGDSFIWLTPEDMFIYQHQNVIIKKNKIAFEQQNPFSQSAALMFKNVVDWEYFPDILHDDGGVTRVLNFYGDNILREITTCVYDASKQGLDTVVKQKQKDFGKDLNYLAYLVLRIIHLLKIDENLLLEKDHNYILTHLNSSWQFDDRYFIDDKILSLVEQYKTKRQREDIPHYSTNMIFNSLPRYKINL